MKNIRVILISGVSGSGKTTAIKALEDIGFYCVDNLPILLIPKFLELCAQSEGKISKVAVVEDIRGYAALPVHREGAGTRSEARISRRIRGGSSKTFKRRVMRSRSSSWSRRIQC